MFHSLVSFYFQFYFTIITLDCTCHLKTHKYYSLISNRVAIQTFCCMNIFTRSTTTSNTVLSLSLNCGLGSVFVWPWAIMGSIGLVFFNHVASVKKAFFILFFIFFIQFFIFWINHCALEGFRNSFHFLWIVFREYPWTRRTLFMLDSH